MREAQGIIINPYSAPHCFVALLFVVSNVKFMLLVSSVVSFLFRNPDQHANRKIGSDAAVCPEETSLLL